MPLSSSPSTHCWRVGEEEVCWWIPYTGWTPCAMLLSYIVFLHQTTTFAGIGQVTYWLSYIVFLYQTTTDVVREYLARKLSYIVFLLHQTTTFRQVYLPLATLSYIVFLHQTTTQSRAYQVACDCLISSFYIKPQPVNGAPGTPKKLSYIVFLHQTTTNATKTH